MMIPGFFEFRGHAIGEPEVSMLVGAIPVVQAGKTELLTPADLATLDMGTLVLVYHLFQRARDPFCVVLPTHGGGV